MTHSKHWVNVSFCYYSFWACHCYSYIWSPWNRPRLQPAQPSFYLAGGLADANALLSTISSSIRQDFETRIFLHAGHIKSSSASSSHRFSTHLSRSDDTTLSSCKSSGKCFSKRTVYFKNHVGLLFGGRISHNCCGLGHFLSGKKTMLTKWVSCPWAQGTALPWEGPSGSGPGAPRLTLASLLSFLLPWGYLRALPSGNCYSWL